MKVGFELLTIGLVKVNIFSLTGFFIVETAFPKETFFADVTAGEY